MILATIAGAIGSYTLHQLLLWMERQGWIYYWYTKSSGSPIGNALMQAQTFIQPEAQYVIDELREEKVHQEWSGDPPVPGRDETNRELDNNSKDSGLSS